VNTTAGFAIRDAHPADAPVLTRIVRSSGAYSGPYRALVAPLTINENYLATNPTRTCVDDRGLVAGFASLLLPGRGTDGEAELDFLFVADDQQGRGIGRALMTDITARALRLGARCIHIVSHPPAEPFYRSLGALRVGEVPPSGRVTWSRPLLRLDIAAPGAAGESGFTMTK
jgi:GNAT superfamily N-acetyltransferase